MIFSPFFIYLYSILPIAFANNAIYSPFTLNLPSFTKECLYYDIVNDEQTLIVSYQVLTGGNFEIDFIITAPDGNEIVKETQKKYSDFVLKSFGLGKYSFCFSNNYGTALKKVEVVLELDKSLQQITNYGGDNNNNNNINGQDVVANNAIEEIDRNLNKITKVLNYLRAREWRNMSTVESTESRLKWLAMLVMLFMVGVSIVQAVVIQFFFKARSKNFV